MSSFIERTTMVMYSLHEHISLDSPKGTLYLNSMRYHGAFIKNTYY